MSEISEIEPLAMDLPENDRALLAAHLLQSLDPVLEDGDDGVAEALQRDADLEKNPAKIISVSELNELVRRRRL